MSTWICKTVLAIFAALTLSGCDAATGLPFAAEFGAFPDGGKARMAQVPLAGGGITLAAPNGYCIDRGSVRRAGKTGFAVMARCDTLGVGGFYDAFDLAIITVTTAPVAEGTPAPTPAALARTESDATVLDSRHRGGLALVRLDGTRPLMNGVGRIHWRGAFVLNGHLVGVSLYAPENSLALRGDGAELIGDVARATRSASAAATKAASAAKKVPAPAE